jgi:hypothetical membrane protein
VAGSLLLAGAMVFLIFTTVAEAEYPGYSIANNALSDLGALGQPTTLLWNGSLFVAGLLQFLGMLAMVGNTYLIDVRRRLAYLLYLVPPIGTMIVAVFPENWILAAHVVGALMALLIGGVSALYSYTFTESPFRYFAVLLGVISLGSFALLGAGPAVGFGLVERLVVYPVDIWLIAFAGYLMTGRE